MLQFSNAPPEPGAAPSLPITRTPATGQIQAIVTSEDLIGTPTHFYGGRTVPCTAPDCEPCTKGVPWRWHGYVSAIGAKRRLHFLFEFTATASDPFIAYRAKYQTLRGCMFTAIRPKHSHNGRVLISCTPADLTQHPLPNPPDLALILCKLWSIPTANASQKGLTKDSPRFRIRHPIPDPQAGNNHIHRPACEPDPRTTA